MTDEELAAALRGALGHERSTELGRDLWPRMRARLDARSAPTPWLDWLLLAASAAAVLAFPHVMLGVLYNL